jgi:hypothetical protein
MPASIKRIRESWNVSPTARDKGLTLTLKVTACVRQRHGGGRRDPNQRRTEL